MEDKQITLPSKESVVKVLMDKSNKLLKKWGIKDGFQEDNNSVFRKEGSTKPKP